MSRKAVRTSCAGGKALSSAYLAQTAGASTERRLINARISSREIVTSRLSCSHSSAGETKGMSGKGAGGVSVSIGGGGMSCDVDAGASKGRLEAFTAGGGAGTPFERSAASTSIEVACSRGEAPRPRRSPGRWPPRSATGSKARTRPAREGCITWYPAVVGGGGGGGGPAEGGAGVGVGPRTKPGGAPVGP